MRHKAEPFVLGLDLNATRARAAGGGAARVPRLGGEVPELPMYLNLERRHVEVGAAGFALCRRLPHLTCSDFLASLGRPRTWQTGRHSLDALQATTLLFQHLVAAVPKVQASVLAVPSYLTRPQAIQLARAAEQARWPVVGTVASSLAAALAAYQQQAWSGAAVVVEVDDHALTLALLQPEGGRMQLLEREVCPHLSARAWKERLLDAIAERCIRRSRRDPRESGAAEQTLYEQLDGAFAACAQGKLADLSIQAGPWYQDLVLRPEEMVGFAARLAGQTLEVLRRLLLRDIRPAPCALILTAAAGNLPGLAAALQESVERPEPTGPRVEASEDFGEALLQPPVGETTVSVLAEDAVARVACELTAAFQHGQLPRGHLDGAAPLPRGARTPGQSPRFGTIA